MRNDPSGAVRHWLGLGILAPTILSGYLLAGPPPARPSTASVEAANGIETTIKDASSRYGLSENVIAAVIEAESQFNPRAVSPKGAQGLMQLMPSTAARLGVHDPFDPRENVAGGTRHLRDLMDRFHNDLPRALAAYNAGEKAVLKHGGVPPYRETREYVTRILDRLEHREPRT